MGNNQLLPILELKYFYLVNCLLQSKNASKSPRTDSLYCRSWETVFFDVSKSPRHQSAFEKVILYYSNEQRKQIIKQVVSQNGQNSNMTEDIQEFVEIALTLLNKEKIINTQIVFLMKFQKPILFKLLCFENKFFFKNLLKKCLFFLNLKFLKLSMTLLNTTQTKYPNIHLTQHYPNPSGQRSIFLNTLFHPLKFNLSYLSSLSVGHQETQIWNPRVIHGSPG